MTSPLRPDLQLRVLHGPNSFGAATLIILSRRQDGATPQDEAERIAEPGPALLHAALAELGLDAAQAAAALPSHWADLVAELSARILAHAKLPPMPVRSIVSDREIAFTAADPSIAFLCLRVALALLPLTQRADAAARSDLNDLWRIFQAEVKSRQGHRPAVDEACRALGLPFHYYSLGRQVQVGEGRHRFLLNLTDTSKTAHLAVRVAKDKVATNHILAANGIPVARQRLAETPEAAWRHALEIGLPVVVKPRDGNLSRGVTIGVADEAGMQQAFAAAHKGRRQVLVESLLPGEEHRVLVVRGRVTGVLYMQRPLIVGDGRRSIRELVDAANQDRVGGKLMPITLDSVSEELLQASGRNFESVPEAGETVVLHTLPRLRFGGVPIDATEKIHPETAAMLVSAAGIIGLDVAGIDFRCPDIARPWTEVGGGICEVNSHAGLEIIIWLRPQWIREGLIAPLAEGCSLRMRHLVVAGGDDARATLDALARHLAEALERRRGWRVGLALTDSLWLARFRASPMPLAPHDAYIRAIENPLLDAAVYVVTPGIVEAHGFGLARLDLALLAASSEPSPPTVQSLRVFCAQAGARVIDRVAAGDIDAIVAQLAEAA